MPPRPGHHLDLFLVPRDGRPVPADTLHDVFTAQGWADGRTPGPHADTLVRGGFSGVRVDQPRERTLYANKQGGFRVACPDTSKNLVPSFQAAYSAWRAGSGPESLRCPHCGAVHTLGELHYAPTAAIGQGAVVLLSVQTSSPEPAALQILHEVLGPVVVVGARR